MFDSSIVILSGRKLPDLFYAQFSGKVLERYMSMYGDFISVFGPNAGLGTDNILRAHPTT